MTRGIEETGAPAPGATVPSMTLGVYLAEAGKALRTTDEPGSKLSSSTQNR